DKLVTGVQTCALPILTLTSLSRPRCASHFKLNPKGECRFVHFSDFHHKGNATYAAEVVRTINDLAPDFVCFTGDLVEQRHFSDEALGFIQQIKAPVYGCPGNHEYSSGVS